MIAPRSRTDEEDVFKEITKGFQVGSSTHIIKPRNKCTFLGLRIGRDHRGYSISQHDYQVEEIENFKDKDSDFYEGEEFRRLLGNLNWVSTKTRPDIQYLVSSGAARTERPLWEDVRSLNRAAKLKRGHEKCL